ncbi:MAG: hypothetical protein ACR2NU_15505 [Aeoliella sp.]
MKRLTLAVESWRPAVIGYNSRLPGSITEIADRHTEISVMRIMILRIALPMSLLHV